MSIFNPETSEKMKKGGNEWLSGEDFEGKGITLQIVSTETVPSAYGVAEDHYFVQQEILKVGETFRYNFKDVDGVERRFDTHSRPFAIGFEQCEGIEYGDWVHITRTGAAKQTRYKMEKVDAPVVTTQPSKDINPKDIPF